MTPAARLAAAIQLLAEIGDGHRPADQVSSVFFKGRRYIGAKDRRAVAEVVWRVLRRRARLAWLIEQAGHADDSTRARALVLADCAVEGIELGRAMFEGAHAAVPLSPDERTLLAKLKGKSLFHREMPAWVRGEYPPWIEPRLIRLFGDDLPRQLGAMRDEAPVDLRVNALKADRALAKSALAAESVVGEPTALSPLGLRLGQRVPLVQLNAWREGLVEVQDEGSQLVALLADAQPGMAVADYCAGAGGKTLALAASMANKGRLVACDVAEWRVDRAQDRLRRAGVHNVTRRVISGESDKWIKRSARSFDRVLVDAPCTGTGTWRRNPDAKWQLGESDLLELTVRQAAILSSASRLVKPGGRLIYATCSMLPDENEDQIARFLDGHPDFSVLPVGQVWSEVIGTACPVPGPYLRLTPLDHGTDGFFAAILVRREEPQG